MTSYSKDTKGQICLERLRSGGFKLFSEEEVLSYNMSPTCKEMVLYVAKMNSFKSVPPRTELRTKFKIGNPDHAFKETEENGMVFDFTMPELLNFYEIDPTRRKDCIPKELSWIRPYISKMSTKSNGKSWNDRKQTPRQPGYPAYFVANVKDKNGMPCYMPLSLTCKR